MKRARPYDRDTALDAAVGLFWTKGYHATSLKDLEAALRMKPGSIYAAFASKEALFLAALERYFLETRQALRSLAEDGESPLTRLADYLKSLGRNETDPDCRACMLIKTLLDTTAADAAIAERARHYLDQLAGDLTAAFDRAKALGELPEGADTARLARRFQADITALRIEAHRGTERTALAGLADDMAADWERLRQQPAKARDTPEEPALRAM